MWVSDNIRSLFTQPFNLKVIQKTPDDAGMGSFPKVRSKDAKPRTWKVSSRGPIFGAVMGSRTSRCQRALTSES